MPDYTIIISKRVWKSKSIEISAIDNKSALEYAIQEYKNPSISVWTEEDDSYTIMVEDSSGRIIAEKDIEGLEWVDKDHEYTHEYTIVDWLKDNLPCSNIQ